ncbi:MAG: FAD-binding oxidoreductase [Gammaproteobacteria bacterium]|nr:FAD-binding oxidoreductase [Gammaproteobacteria bacterium]MDH4253970.1 FAD-binding oxidoreductase [Gammaproteobacteria bacterium]MDH5308889.1 FAD-binding oxidoreductase [Gammaproteobacteria bacterium]
MSRPELLVVGGGIVGLSAAIAAAQHGAAVTLIDAAINAGTTANAGSLHVQLQSRFLRLYPDQAHNVEASLHLYLEAVREWDRLEANHGPFEMVRHGGLMLAENATQLKFLEAKARREAARGLDVDILERAALGRIAPWLGPQVFGAELCRDEGKLNPLTANIRLRAVARRLGTTFVKDRIVTLTVGDNVQLRGELGLYKADQAIVAAAWGSGRLLGGLGLALPSRAEPLHMNITEPAAASIQHLVQHAERSITLKQLQSGQIVIGGGWPAQSRGDDVVPAVLADSVLGNIALAGKLVPGIRELRVIRTWAGMNTTVDGKTALGRIPGAERVIVAVPGDAGYTLGPLCGRLASELAAGLPGEVDTGPYSPARFAAR